MPRSRSATGSPCPARSTPSRSWPRAPRRRTSTGSRSSSLGADEPGVYWFGVHALGTNAAGRDAVADGRARTFLPYVPPKDRGRPIDTALVAARSATRCCTRPTAAWPTSTSGSRRSARAVGSRRSWTSGSPRAACRSPGWSTPPSPTPPTRSSTATRPASWSTGPRARPGRASSSTDDARRRRVGRPGAAPAGAGPVRRGPGGRRRAVAGQAQPGRHRQAGPGPAVGRRGRRRRGQAGRPDVYEDARALSGTVLKVGQCADDRGHLGPQRLPRRRGHRRDRPGHQHPDLRPRRDPRRGAQRRVVRRPPVVFYSSAARAAAPGRTTPTARSAMRQQVLSEAALRMDEPGRRPLVVVFPPTWTPPGPDYTQFYDGLDVNWMQLDLAGRRHRAAAAAAGTGPLLLPPVAGQPRGRRRRVHLVRRPDRGGATTSRA